MNKEEILVEIARLAYSPQSSDEDLLLIMVLLHTHAISLHDEVTLQDARTANGSNIVIPAITRWSAARVAATLVGAKGKDINFWYGQYEHKMPYEILSDVPIVFLERLMKIKELMVRSPYVEDILPED